MVVQAWPKKVGLIHCESGRIEREGGKEGRGRDKHCERGERGDTEAVPQAVKRQLAQRCVRPIFSFPLAHLSLKQLRSPCTLEDFGILQTTHNKH